jgi:glycosyltransferase involved in cell wall biosynthesis
VVHLTSVHVPFDTRIFQKECRTLAEAGYRVSLVATHTKREAVNGIVIIPLPYYSRRLTRMLLGPWIVFWIARDLQADLYHFHDPELLLTGVLLKRLTRAEVIYDAHENYAGQMGARGWMPRLLRPVVPPLVGSIEKLCARTFSAVISATEYIGAKFCSVKTVTVNNYPLLDLASLPLSERPYRADNCRLIYTGGWSNHRGVYQLVQALSYVKNAEVRLTVLGRCVDPFVKNQAEKLPGFTRVDYTGMVPYDELYEHMRHSAIGLVCNQPRYDYDKSQPNKLFEYMSAGLPVIASDFPLWRKIVHGNECGLTVDPTRPAQIGQAIDQLLSDPARRRQMGENGRRAVLSKYNWPIEGQKLVRLYQELLDEC